MLEVDSPSAVPETQSSLELLELESSLLSVHIRTHYSSAAVSMVSVTNEKDLTNVGETGD